MSVLHANFTFNQEYLILVQPADRSAYRYQYSSCYDLRRALLAMLT